MGNEQEILLRVEHLKQYFKMGKGNVKAVDDVSFSIKKGEVFGLVGESGCGKTTTGRSIIKLYNVTGGDVYFMNQRISAGTGDYNDNVTAARKNAEDKINAYKSEAAKQTATSSKDTQATLAKYDALIKEEEKKLADYLDEQKKRLASAKYDNKSFEKNYTERMVNEITKKYNNEIESYKKRGSSENAKAEILKLSNERDKQIHLAKKDKLMTKIQMIFQDPIASLNPRMTVREIIAEGLVIKNIKDKEYINKKVFEVLELVGLVPEHASRYPHEFSGGQRQRIGIARAIIMEPSLIIADEPISALDVSIQAQVINLLNDLREKMNLTIMFVAHDLSVVKYFSDRIGVMYYGKLIELAASDELFANPLHPYTKSLLSAIPLPDPHYEKRRKRFTYNPSVEHDYSIDKPSLFEVSHEHFVYCNEKEYSMYKSSINI